MIKQFFTRMRFFLFPPRSADLDDELQFHLQQAIECNLTAGMTAEEARRQAHLLFGAVAATREQCHQQRPGWWLSTLAQDARYALRGFRRNPAFALTVIATLALGIGATTAVLSVVDRILFRSLPYAHDDQLVSLGLVQPLERQEFMLGGFYYEWRNRQQPFASLTFERGTHECNLTEANSVHLQCAAVAQNFLPTLGISPLLGRNFLPEEDVPHGPAVALISDGLWLRRFNRDPAVLNKQILMDQERFRVIGVLPRDFEMPRLQATDIIVPAQMDEAAQHTLNAGIGQPMWVFARLKPGVTVQQAKDQMQPLFLHTQQWIPKEFRNEFHLQVRSIRDRQMQEAYLVAWVLLAAVIAVLLIACANVAGLFSARAAARERELAVPSALGASRGRLIRQTMTEAVLLASAGAAAGGLLAGLLLRVFISIAPSGLPFLTDARIDSRIISFTVLLSLFCAVLFGLLPALHQPNVTTMVARQSRSTAHTRLRRFLVVAQIGVSVVLLSAAGLLLKSFRNLEQQDLGMQTRHVLTVHIPLSETSYSTSQACMDFYLRAEKALQSLPGVTAVAMSNSLPPDSGSWHDSTRYADIFVVGQPAPAPATGGTVVVRAVTPAYFRVLQIPILQGQGFTEEDRQSGSDLIILSKLLASRLFPQGNAVGQHIQRAVFEPYRKMGGPVFTIVGVAGNVKNAGLANQDDPEFYTLWTERRPEAWSRHHVFLLQTAFPPAIAGPWIRSRIAQLDPILPVDIDTLSGGVTRLADRPRFQSALIGFFAACGLLMAVIGLYGVISYVATQRRQEVGVRMALGATRANILGLIAAEGIRLILLGSVLGLIGALATAQIVRHLMFHVGTRDVSTYAAVLFVLATVALAATLIPAVAAMRTDPGEALRYE